MNTEDTVTGGSWTPPQPVQTAADAVNCADRYLLRFARWRGVAIATATENELRAIIAALIREHPAVRKEMLGR